MPFPCSRLADQTATGDTITGPGSPTVLVGGKPVSNMGDAIAGPACTGAITMGSPTVLATSRPVSRVTSTVTGVNPASGVPVATTVAVGEPTVLVP